MTLDHNTYKNKLIQICSMYSQCVYGFTNKSILELSLEEGNKIINNDKHTFHTIHNLNDWINFYTSSNKNINIKLQTYIEKKLLNELLILGTKCIRDILYPSKSRENINTLLKKISKDNYNYNYKHINIIDIIDILKSNECVHSIGLKLLLVYLFNLNENIPNSVSSIYTIKSKINIYIIGSVISDTDGSIKSLYMKIIDIKRKKIIPGEYKYTKGNYNTLCEDKWWRNYLETNKKDIMKFFLNE